MKKIHVQGGFTIMEILITVLIVGIIAAFAIPNYGKSVDQTHIQDAVMQLSAIRTANQVYYARRSEYWPSTSTHPVNEINANLSLSIIENGKTYNCDGNGTTFTCTAKRSGVQIAGVTEAPLSTTNPGCPSAGTACN
ncbi:MAG: type II secretion system protein [Candidatus Omnitrophica bacterium]|nr:type II secretion system protein [Candidatus Omnitrophota bacterium]